MSQIKEIPAFRYQNEFIGEVYPVSAELFAQSSQWGSEFSSTEECMCRAAPPTPGCVTAVFW
ncbi:MAG TPA: hypothetical protein VF319_10285 [Caldimonas sp.]